LLLVGIFDPILSTPLAALFTFVSLGVLAPRGQSARIKLGRPVGAASTLCGLGLIIFALRRTTQEITATRMAEIQIPPDLADAAVRNDPANYLLRMKVAQDWLDRGKCERAIVHLRAAHNLYPFYPAPVELARVCDGGEKSPSFGSNGNQRGSRYHGDLRANPLRDAIVDRSRRH